MKKSKLRGLIIFLIVVILIAAAIFALVFYNKKKAVNENLDLGSKYMESMNYEDAISAYIGAIAVDSKSAEAYLGIIEAYMRTQDYDSALKVALEGYDKTGDKRIKIKIEILQNGGVQTADGQNYRTTSYNPDGSIAWVHEFTYDDNGRVDTVTHIDAGGRIVSSIQLQYDGQGRAVVNWAWSNRTGALIKIESTYEGDKQVRSVSTPLSGKGSKEECEYSYSGDKVEKITTTKTNSEGEQTTVITTITYDGSGHETEKTFTDENGNLLSTYQMAYDGSGNLICLVKYKANESGELHLSEKIEYELDGDGNILVTKYYDGAGNLKSESRNQ